MVLRFVLCLRDSGDCLEFLEWSAMVSKLRRGVLGSRARSEPKEFWQMQSRLMGERSNIPAGLQGKYRQAVAAKWGEWSTGSSTSSGEEDRKTRSLEAENKELRARIDAMEKKERVQGGPSSLLKKKEIRKMCGEISWRSKMRPRVARNWMNGRSARGEVEKKRHDLMPEHQKAQKRSQNIQTLQDKRRSLQNDSIAAEEEMRKLQEELR